MVLFLFKLYYRLKGWKIGTPLPSDLKKCIVLAAPHTSNWDFVYGIVSVHLFKLKINYLAKRELFVWPIKNIFLQSGGIPVERKGHHHLVENMIELIKSRDSIILAIPPEGTRKAVKKWKTGFYHMAIGANVPVVLGYIDYKTRTAGFGPALFMSGDKEKDAKLIRSFYEKIQAKYPENFNLDAINLT
ncbi:MAG TPA: 1-acyl-sn-glycerol-3-phosphate acyltransferase [Bacteroidia bacterium]|nr:1-acyl-sn-glycerol-3-phosphate acyltransferase [Bacteroidia bacterium]